MRFVITAAAALLFIGACSVYAGPKPVADFPGFLKAKSGHDFERTTDRLETVLEEKGLTIFAEIDHAAGAATVEMDLEPSTVFVFGNPKVGTPLMQIDPMMAYELPLRILVQQRGDDVWLVYRDPSSYSKEFDLVGLDGNLNKISDALDDVVMDVIQSAADKKSD